MFGDEPYGNYNRILLSSVLAGSHDAKDIFINPLAWYEEKRRAPARGRAGHRHRPRGARRSHGAGGVAEPYDHLVLATGSVPFVPPVEGLKTAGGGRQAGRVRLPHARRLRRHHRLREERRAWRR